MEPGRFRVAYSGPGDLPKREGFLGGFGAQGQREIDALDPADHVKHHEFGLSRDDLIGADQSGGDFDPDALEVDLRVAAGDDDVVGGIAQSPAVGLGRLAMLGRDRGLSQIDSSRIITHGGEGFVR